MMMMMMTMRGEASRKEKGKRAADRRRRVRPRRRGEEEPQRKARRPSRRTPESVRCAWRAHGKEKARGETSKRQGGTRPSRRARAEAVAPTWTREEGARLLLADLEAPRCPLDPHCPPALVLQRLLVPRRPPGPRAPRLGPGFPLRPQREEEDIRRSFTALMNKKE